ncbi:MAG: hypothetical protein IJW73_03330, partial [Candidatus Gastranaerophilales bacterium]|nr:hypothetical protein [Candidatus Gastranaerophilales bacterium]
SALCLQNNYSLRKSFANNSSIVYTINIRNFGAVDKNNNGIIEEELGDIRGTFLNAASKLEELKKEGIDVIYLLPITKVGKLKALGTAGSLYAMDSFDEINPQLDDLSNSLTVKNEAEIFVKKAHQLGLKVIVDLPSCGSYDLSLKKPNWFIIENNEAVIPSDWTDVRLFKVYNEDKSLNKENIANFKRFVDLAQSLELDGIRDDVAAIKPYGFLKKIISYARDKNPDFLFIAEANPMWGNPAEKGVEKYATVEELLSAGFDSYYGSWTDFKTLKTKADFDLRVNNNLKILKKHKKASIMSSLATHDQQAPILRGYNYWNMILWINVSLPINSYFLDGFKYGDDYTYSYENKKTNNSLTDDEYYFVHSGLFDIFNLSAEPKIKHPYFKKEYLRAIAFKKANLDLFKNGKMKLLKTDNDKVFAYSFKNRAKELLVIGSLDEKNIQNVSISSKYLKEENLFTMVNVKSRPKLEFLKGKLSATLEPLELQVFLINLVNPQED